MIYGSNYAPYTRMPVQCIIDHFARCKQRWSRSTSCFSFLTLHKSWDKIQPTEHVKLYQKVKQHL